MNALVTWAMNKAMDRYESRPTRPDFIIGRKNEPQVYRWYGIPRNPFFNIYYHIFLRSDQDFALHDHPWLWNYSVLVEGEYAELRPDPYWVKTYGLVFAASKMPPVAHLRTVGDSVFRWGRSPHRIELIDNRPCHTVFITGPKYISEIFGKWGFYCPRGKIPFNEIVKYETGKGSEPKDGCP